jgi:stage V sporulation protein G
MSKVTDCKVFPAQGQKSDKVVAFGKITLNGDIVIDGIRLIQGKNGLFVGMPSRKTSQGNFSDIVFATTKELKDEIQKAAIAEYNKMGKPAESSTNERQSAPVTKDDDDDLPF